MTTKISIITATYNAATTIKDCLDSVHNQTYHPIEHIIIDGGSTDGTAEYILGFPPKADPTVADRSQVSDFKAVSEPDNGLYDAMNKGIHLATADVVGILNADDYYASASVLETVAGVFEDPKIDSCYGDLVYVEPNKINKIVRYWRAGHHSVKDFYWGWMPPHPTFFVRRKIYERYGGFQLNLGTAADYELMLRLLLKHQIKSAYIPKVLVHMRVGGASNISLKNRIAANQMDKMAWNVNGLKPYPWTLHLKPLRKLGQWFAREK